jgi:8-oxo-dGTP pyrophosphatase MutT (NUDIX family)
MQQNINIYVQNNKIIIGNTMNIGDGAIKIVAGIRQQDVYYIVDDVYNKKESIQISETEGQDVFGYFAKEMKNITAAGGLVFNEHKQLLMIHRNGIWDLPKGKLEKEEDIENCAMREVQEETNCQQLKIESFLKHTYHIYKQNNQYILKQTYWYTMNAPLQDLVPQLEEGITEVKWVNFDEIKKYVLGSYDNIKNLFHL